MKSIIFKLSGKALDEFTTNKKWVKVLEDAKENYDGVIIVHGAGSQISEWSKLLKIEPKFLNGMRVTDIKTMEVVAAVQSGLLNSKIVSYLQTNKVSAMGLTGIDRGFFKAEYIHEDFGYVGIPKAEGSNVWIKQLMEDGIVPVFSTVCKDEDGNLMNINADLFTQALAESLGSSTVVFITDVDGVRIGGAYKDNISIAEINKGIETGDITDGMIPKMHSCIEMINRGVEKLWIGRDYLESFTGKGTWIIKEVAQNSMAI
jgi:acetylglutamate kinase